MNARVLLAAAASAALALTSVGIAAASAGTHPVLTSTSAAKVRTVTARGNEAAFTTPSGNVTCYMTVVKRGRADVRCDITNRTWKVKKPRTCELDYGHALYLYGGRGTILCAGDTALGTAALSNKSATRWFSAKRDVVVRAYGMRQAGLRYGTALKLADTTCVSAKTGVTCTNSKRHGFLLSKSSYRTW